MTMGKTSEAARARKLAGLIKDRALAERVEAAVLAVLVAGGILREKYGQPIAVSRKGPIDLVTEADFAAEEAVCSTLERWFPGGMALTEEKVTEIDSTMSGWVVDPLDGTTNFAHGFPWFAVSVGWVEQGVPLTGAIYAPMLDELFVAARGCGAFLNGRRIKVSRVKTLEESLVATGFPYSIREKSEEVTRLLAAVLKEVQGVRRAGAAALDLAYVACGRLDGFFEQELKPWDVAAGGLLVEEAGGRVTGYRGKRVSIFDAEIVATNTSIHRELVGILSRFAVSPS